MPDEGARVRLCGGAHRLVVQVQLTRTRDLATISSARVLLPTCRAPLTTTTRVSPSALGSHLLSARSAARSGLDNLVLAAAEDALHEIAVTLLVEA